MEVFELYLFVQGLASVAVGSSQVSSSVLFFSGPCWVGRS